MVRPPATSSQRPATDITLPADLLAEAGQLGLNVSQVCEGALRAEIAKSKAEQWRTANREALTSSNDYVERHGLPLSEFRLF